MTHNPRKRPRNYYGDEEKDNEYDHQMKRSNVGSTWSGNNIIAANQDLIEFASKHSLKINEQYLKRFGKWLVNDELMHITDNMIGMVYSSNAIITNKQKFKTMIQKEKNFLEYEIKSYQEVR